MPHIYDFSKLNYVNTIELKVDGWISPLYIEYAIDENEEDIPVKSYVWRIKGTQHTFVIPVARLNFISDGDFKKHFQEVLVEFREQYIEWRNQQFYIEWMSEYREQYSSYII